MRILIANVTSWAAGWRGLTAACADVYCVQEARVTPVHSETLQTAARRQGLHMQLGTMDDEGQHLLAFAHRSSVCLRAVGIDGLNPDQEKRMQYAVVHLGRQRALHIVQIYGYADGAAAVPDNERLVLAALAWLRSLGDVPALIVGDLNLIVHGSSVEPVLAMSGWSDLLAPAGPTCLPSSGVPSRIDYVFANRAAQSHVVAAGLRWDLGLATHAALELELQAEAPEMAWMRRPATPLSGTAHDAWAAARAGVTAEVVHRHGSNFRRALRDDDLDEAWCALGAAMRAWLSRRLGHTSEIERGYASAEWRAARPRTTGAAGEAQDQAADDALLRLRRLRSLKHAANHWTLASQPARAVLAALRRDEADAAWVAALERVERGAESVADCIDRAEHDHTSKQRQAQARRRESWHEWVHDALGNGGGRLYRWIKADSAVGAPMVPDPSVLCSEQEVQPRTRRWLNSLRGGPAAQLRHFEHHWRKLWQRQTKEADDIEQWLSELDSLPAFPDRVPWSIAFVRAVLKRMAVRKAPGLDAWTVAELRLLPDELLSWIVELFEHVERRGHWPAELSRPEGLLLPKPGDGGPLDRRPIWLLPMLYRVWAAGRAQLFARWRSSWGDGDGSDGAEELAWDLALELEAAEANEETICGSALDWRKAFDHVSLGLLRKMLTRAGVPNWIREPMLAAYSSPRRLRVDSALGQPWTPTSGILPGCALAVFALSVLVRPWYQKTGRIHDSLRRRVYVDDLTVWARGDADVVAEAVADALAITRVYERDLDWHLHEVKSKQFANTAAARRWLQQHTPAIGVGTVIRDLGVVASAGPRRRAPVSAARLRLARGRFGRIRRIPASFRWRCLLGAAAGTAAGMYGASCGRPPARELEQLRRAARAAVCHGQRAAAEIVFGVLSPTWRLDPKATAVLAPVVQAVRAMRSGRLDLTLWRTTAAAVSAGAGRPVGPVSAAVASLQSLGLGSDIETWAGAPSAPHGWRPAEHPRRASVDVLLAAWARAECRKVASRRGDYAHIANGCDRWATRRLLGSASLSAESAGALRSVLCGSVVSEAVASKWNGRTPLCPHCGLADEDLEHRLWWCPAWDAARLQALADMPPEAPRPLDVAVLRRQLHPGVARTGTLPLSARLAALADAAAGDDPQLPPPAEVDMQAPKCTIWTDGGCLHPTDPLLARAAWGLRCADLENCNWGGPVGGKQTAQRAEVTALVAATRLIGAPIDLVSDSEYVVNTSAKIAAGADVSELEHADLWQQASPHLKSGRVRARWVPAHKSAAEASRLGVSERDRLGNAAADSAAGAVARGRMACCADVAARQNELWLLEAAQRVQAAAQLASLKAASNRREEGAPRARRVWSQVRRGARARVRSAPPVGGAAPGPRVPSRAVAPPAARGADLRAFFAGRAWQPHAAARGPGRVTCLRCAASAAAWSALSASPCRGWSEQLPAQALGLLLLGDLCCAGGSVAEFDVLVRQRLAQLPQAPD